MPSVEKKKSVDVVNGSAESEKISTEIRELKNLALGMNEKIRELNEKMKRLRPRGAGMRWCVLLAAEPDHFAGNCPHNEGGNRARGLPRATDQESPCSRDHR